MKMTRWTLSWRGMLYFWRSHLGAILGLFVASTVLTGALLVGDCVRSTLQSIALNRLGKTQYALYHPTRFVREDLASEIGEELSIPSTGVLRIDGVALHPANDSRANRVAVYGVSEGFWDMAFDDAEFQSDGAPGVVLNRRLADTLQAKPGDMVLLRVEKPSAISRDAPLSTDDDSSVAMRLPVIGIAGDRELGRLDLRANQVTPSNAFVPLDYLQTQIEQTGRINMILAGDDDDSPVGEPAVSAALQSHWTLEDAQIELRYLEKQSVTELRSDRIFLNDAVAQNTQFRTSRDTYGVLTYLVNDIKTQDGRSVPYSMVSAIGDLNGSKTIFPALGGLQDDETVINQWLADDLKVKEGDSLTFAYYVMGPLRKLTVEEKSFRIKRIVPMGDPICDPELMPDFPGITDADNCRDWDPGFAIDNTKIRDRDEAYWDTYRGTPKAFISLNAGQQLWSNRFGSLTAIRVKNTTPQRLASQLKFDPESFGFYVQPVHEQALKAVQQSMSFGGLFISLSFFLIVAALLLSGLLFLFSIEQRVEETGILLGIGLSHRNVRRMFLAEGLLIAIIGCGLGLLGAIGYTRAMLWLLATVWSGAVAGTTFQLFLSPVTLNIGFLSSVIAGMLTLWLGIRNQTKLPVRELLTSAGMFTTQLSQTFHVRALGGWIVGAVGIVGAVALLMMDVGDDAMAAAGKFFGVGSLLLVAALGLSRGFFALLGNASKDRSFSIGQFGMRNNARRIGRSLTITGLLACGSFLVIGVGIFRLNSSTNADQRRSGTGGFDYYVEMTLPLLHDLNTEKGCNTYGLSRSDIEGSQFVPMRVREGDDASCLNLNHAQQPQLLALNPDTLAGLDAFKFINTIDGPMEAKDAWRLLDRNDNDRVVPGMADQASIQWAMGKKLGDTLDYTDESGNTFHVQLVAAFDNSIFQGNIVIAEDAFTTLYPSVSGYKAMLADMPNDRAEKDRKLLTDSLQDIGADFVTTSERLGTFYAVQNTYITIFQALGGLGLILGCAGIGVVVLRNILERRGELAILRAVGIPIERIRWMVLSEHWLLLILGLLCGTVAGVVAVWPAIVSNATDIPYLSLGLTLLLMLASGLVCIWIATWFAMRGPILDALRNE